MSDSEAGSASAYITIEHGTLGEIVSFPTLLSDNVASHGTADDRSTRATVTSNPLRQR